MRYQLLKTSPYLGGQIRWDIPMYFHYDDGVHVVDTPELHIVPLDDNITFNEGNDWETLNYTHLENIKHLFSQIGDAFFSASGEWLGNHWLYNEGDILDPYSHIYNMGARRTRFKRYEKQFSYLCPLWISEETDPTKFAFEVSVKVSGEERDHIVRRIFKLSPEICTYMKEYLDKSARYVEPDPAAPDPGYQGVNNDLLSIKFDPDYAFITGVQADAGKYTTQDVTYMISSLLEREIPMMEFDNMLVSKFRQSNIVAQQLINLNFLFNMEDISYVLKESLIGKHIGISLKVMYDGEYLPIKDFYTNYSDIPVYRVDRGSLSKSENVCDYMGDHKIVDYMYVNKFTQPIFHWAMVENPTYIYNFYDGFAPTFMENGELQRIQGRYYDQADISQDHHTVYNSAATWCKLVDMSEASAATSITYDNQVLMNPDLYTSQLFINKDTGIAYLNNNRYNLAQLVESEYGFYDWPPIYIYTVVKSPGQIIVSDPDYPDDRSHDITVNSALIIDWDGSRIIIRIETDSIYESTYFNYHQLIPRAMGLPGCTFEADGRTFAIRMVDNTLPPRDLDNPTMIEKIMWLMHDMYGTWIPPYRIDFAKTTLTVPVDAFDRYHPEELNMYKYDSYHGYVLRYTGGLCPLFIDPTDEYYRNINYRYIQWSDITTPEVQQYNKFLKTGMNPDYPSIGYYSFEHEWDTMERPDWYEQWPWEVAWKNDGCIFILPEWYKTEFIESNPIPYTSEAEEEKMWAKLYDYIDSIGIPTLDSVWMKHKLKELYRVSYNFDYASETNVNEIKYYVRFDLR